MRTTATTIAIQARQACFIVDEAGCVLHYDEAAACLFGLAVNGPPGLRLDHLVPELVSLMPAPAELIVPLQLAGGQTCRCRIGQRALDLDARLTVVTIGAELADLAVPAVAGSRELLAALVDSSNDAIITKTLQGIVTSWNPAAEKMFGYRAGQMIGQPITRLLPAERIAEEQHILSQLAQGRKVEHFETERRCSDGTLIAVSVTVSPILDTAGRVAGASKIVRDISDKRRAEEELRAYRAQLQHLVAATTGELSAIVRTAANAIVTADGDGIIDVFNPAAEQMFGWTHEEMRGRSIDLLMPRELASDHQRHLRGGDDQFSHRVLGVTREIRAMHRNGATFPISIALGHTEIVPGQPYFVAFISDISAQKHIEEDLRRARDEAESAARTKASFLANMSHEIRTPMNAIIGFSDLVLQDQALPSNCRAHVDTVRQSAMDLLSIINDILDFSKIERGKAELENVPFNLYNLVRNVLRLLTRDAEHKHVTLRLEYPDAVARRCVGDPTKLRQILVNLVGNAVKFTQAGTVTVALAGDSDGGIRFSVADTGIGMTDSQLMHVFDPFTQADSSTTRRFGGTGLGTTICRQLVTLMGGRIWAESRHGEGSTFHFALALRALEQGQRCLYEDDEASDQPLSAPRAFRILLAEDIATNARLVELRLGQLGHELVWKQTGRQAVEACAQGDYDVVLMDVMMPDLDGLEATRAIRQQRRADAPFLPILALTASVMPEDHARCLAAGMDHILGKPVQFSELCAQMERLVPAGRGRAVDGAAGLAPCPPAGALEPLAALAAVVDLPRALRLWGDARTYLLALRDFSLQHGGDGPLICRSLEQDGALAVRLVHGLKGAAGNLLLTQVAECATKAHLALKQHHGADALGHALDLRRELERACMLIDREPAIAAPPPAHAVPARDPAVLLRSLRNGLEQCNPDDVAALLEELDRVLERGQLAPVQNAVRQFDFDQAATLVDQLSVRLAGGQPC